MRRVFLDSNVLLRFLTTDDFEQRTKAKVLLGKASSGEILLVTGPPVLFEISWVLRKAYKKSPGEVVEILKSILTIPGLELTDAPIVKDALTLAAAADMEFADAYITSSAQVAGAEEIATFNTRHFERVFDLYPL
jgi:predicted nucleic acid-binding protein